MRPVARPTCSEATAIVHSGRYSRPAPPTQTSRHAAGHGALWATRVRRRLPKRLVLLVAVLFLTWMTFSTSVSAHAFLKLSTPDQDTVVPQAPPEILMSFTERIEPQFSSAQLFDANGTLVPTGASHVGSDPTVLILPLSGQLPDGTYTVQWKNVSADDGHANSGYFAFTVGAQSNVVIPSPPTVATTTLFDRVVSVTGRWLGILGLAAAIGSFFTWLFAIAPAIVPLPDERRASISRRLRGLALCGVVTAAVGSLILLASQSLTSSGSISPDAISSVLSTRFGAYWLLRMALLLLLGIAVWWQAPWREQAQRQAIVSLAIVALLAPIPYALVSHAAAQPSGRSMAIAVDWLHLFCAGIWIGGLLALVVGAVTLAGMQSMQRRVVYASLIPRFSTLAIGSVLILAITGFYASWLEVGNLSALTGTGYGEVLILKLALLVPVLLLGAGNLLFWGPGMMRRKSAPERFGRSVVAEASIGVLILLTVGLLTSLPTARETLSATADHPIFNFDRQGIRATLQITPSVAGLNKYTVDTSSHAGPLPAGTQVLLRVSQRGQLNGQREINVPQLPGSSSRFESQGRDLSVVGDWQLELVVRQPNKADWTVDTDVNVTRSASEQVNIPGPPPRFAGLTALAAVLLSGFAVARLLAGLRGARMPGQRLSTGRWLAGDGIVLIGICGLLLGVSWTGPAPSNNQSNPIKMTSSSVITGQTIFAQNCVVCHGENGFGDGLKAATLNPPPADFHARHLDDHTDLQLFTWIQNGIPGTAMPAFKGKLTDDQIWNLVNFVRSFRHPV